MFPAEKHLPAFRNRRPEYARQMKSASLYEKLLVESHDDDPYPIFYKDVAVLFCQPRGHSTAPQF
jgi:hypothetical protein